MLLAETAVFPNYEGRRAMHRVVSCVPRLPIVRINRRHNLLSDVVSDAAHTRYRFPMKLREMEAIATNKTQMGELSGYTSGVEKCRMIIDSLGESEF